LNILILNPFFEPYAGGTEKHLLNIGKRLSKKHNITVLTARLKDTEREEEIEGMRIVRTPAKIYYKAPKPLVPPVPVFSNHNKDLDVLAKDADIIHMHNRFVYGSFEGTRIKKYGKKVCLTIHNARTEGIDAVTDFFGCLFDDTFGRKLMMSCDGITSVSGAVMESTVPKDYKGLKKVIYNGVDEKLFVPGKKTDWRKKLGIKRGMVLTNVRLITQKGIEYLMKGMTDVDAELVVFGRGPLENKLMKLADKLDVKVHFLRDYISDKDLASLVADCDCFVLPSLYEPCAVALVEALSCGLPIVATDAGGNKELVEDGKNGFIVPVKDPKAIAEKVNMILGDKKLAEKFGKRSRGRVLKKFNWNYAAKEFNSFYEELI